MDFNTQQQTNNLHAINGGAGGGFKTNPQSLASSVMPAPVQQLMQGIAQKHGLKFDAGKVDLKKLTPEIVNGVGKVADLVAKNSRALPILYKHMVKLLKSEVAEAQFYAAVTKECLMAKTKIDEATAGAFLELHGYKARASKLEAKVNAAVKILDARTNAYSRQYEGRAGDSIQIVDAWMEESKLISNHAATLKKQEIKTLGASKRADAEYLSKMKHGHQDVTPNTRN